MESRRCGGNVTATSLLLSNVSASRRCTPQYAHKAKFHNLVSLSRAGCLTTFRGTHYLTEVIVHNTHKLTTTMLPHQFSECCSIDPCSYHMYICIQCSNEVCSRTPMSFVVDKVMILQLILQLNSRSLSCVRTYVALSKYSAYVHVRT